MIDVADSLLATGRRMDLGVAVEDHRGLIVNHEMCRISPFNAHVGLRLIVVDVTDPGPIRAQQKGRITHTVTVFWSTARTVGVQKVYLVLFSLTLL